MGPKFLSLSLVVLFLVLLGFAPGWLRKTHHQFEVPAPAGSGAVIPLDRPFAVVSGRGHLPPGTKTPVTLGSLLNAHPKGLILNFWATWCTPCLDEIPSLDYLSRQLSRTSGAAPVVVTISVDEAATDVLGLFETLDFAPELLVLHDPDGEFSASLGTTRFPETYWVTTGGKIRHKWIGPQNWLAEEVLGLFLGPLGPSS